MLFSCPSCQQGIEADESYSGATIECPACQQPFTIPEFQEKPDREAEEPQTASVSRPQSQPRPPPPPPRPPPPPPKLKPALETSEPASAAGAESAGPAVTGSQPLGSSVKVGGGLASAGLGAGLSGLQMFRGVTYHHDCYYLPGAGTREGPVACAIAETIQARAPEALKVKVVQARARMGGPPRQVVWVRWGIGHGYVICFSPGTDLFVSARVNFVPGCLARACHLFRPVEPSLFGVDDLNMLFFCLTRSVGETLDRLQLAYVGR